MPIFEYCCSDCNHITEFLEKADARGRHECEKCGGAKLSKQFSSFSAHGGGSLPCADGTCPTGGQAGSTCATGTCPFS